MNEKKKIGEKRGIISTNLKKPSIIFVFFTIYSEFCSDKQISSMNIKYLIIMSILLPPATISAEETAEAGWLTKLPRA